MLIITITISNCNCFNYFFNKSKNEKNKIIDFLFKINDSVRISKYKNLFEKGYTPNWTNEIFTIAERIPRSPPVYKIKDKEDEIIEGVFYEAELQKVVLNKLSLPSNSFKPKVEWETLTRPSKLRKIDRKNYSEKKQK